MDEIELVRSLPAPAPASNLERDRIRSRFVSAVAQRSAEPRTLLDWWRRLRRAALLAATAMLLVGTLSAVGAAIFAEWGGREVAVTADEIRAEIRDTQASIALPPGDSYPDLFPHFAAPNNLARYLGVQQVQFYAMCSWSNYWLSAHAAGDSAALAAATAAIAEFPTWQSIADPRIADDSIRNHIDEVVAAAAAGEPAPVQGLVEAACP